MQSSQNYTDKEFSLLYAQYNENNYFNQNILKYIAKTFHTSVDVEDTINKYINFKEINGSFFDFVILDNRLGIDICEEILKINPNQKIIIKVRLDNNQNLSTFYINGFDDFIYEPLSTFSIEKTMSNIARKSTIHNSSQKTVEEIVTEYENKLQESQRKLEQRNDFFASISHEIRTPMNAIIGMSQIFIDDKSLSKEQLETAKTINKSSNMLLGIINDILDFSKMEAGKISLENISFDLNMVLTYLADMLKLQVQEKNLKLIFDIDHKIAKSYFGDPLRISQLLLNLLGNAVKFTEKGSIRLNIKTLNHSGNKSTIEFEVADTGIGMSEQQTKEIFKSYTQASTDTTRKYGGTGLGLSISQQLVDIMGGEISVKSTLGEGTTFVVKITLDTDSEKRKYRLPSKDIMKMKVVIIDSDLESINSLTNLIEYFHMSVKSASTLKESKKVMDKNKFDLLFIDKSMYDLIDIESYKEKNDFHVVLIEDWADISKKKKTDFSIVDEVLKKPFHQQMIFETISTLYSLKGIPNNEKQTDRYIKEDIKALGKHKILVVEDNIINQKVMTNLLKETSLDIEFADDGEIALDMLSKSKNPYKLILMDINMPNLDGYMTTQRIRQKSEFNNIAIVGLSGHTREEDIQKAKDIGMQGYLVKPINVKALYDVLIQHLRT